MRPASCRHANFDSSRELTKSPFSLRPDQLAWLFAAELVIRRVQPLIGPIDDLGEKAVKIRVDVWVAIFNGTTHRYMTPTEITCFDIILFIHCSESLRGPTVGNGNGQRKNVFPISHQRPALVRLRGRETFG